MTMIRKSRHHSVDPLNGGSGIGVDVYGDRAVDPTENVKALVEVEKKHIVEIRELTDRHQTALRLADAKLQDVRSEAETRRLDQLAALRLVYDTQASENLRVQAKTTSDLVSTALDKVTNSLGTQITSSGAAFSSQLVTMRDSIAVQISDLNRFRWESGGKSSVSDPDTREALAKLSVTVHKISMIQEEVRGRRDGAKETVVERQLNIGQILAIASTVFLGLTVLIATAAFVFHR
jgi:hypothetical protein